MFVKDNAVFTFTLGRVLSLDKGFISVYMFNFLFIFLTERNIGLKSYQGAK